MRILFLIFSLVLFNLNISPAHAQDEKLVNIRLLPETSRIEAGDTIWIGIEQSIEPGWHTYWKNPGDSGTAPVVNWDLPDGFKVGDLHWPTPEAID